jgi:ribose-phosphate pyrophosphokinase
VVLDTVNLPEEKLFPKLTVLSAAPLIAAAIKRINQNTSISELFGQWG